MASRQGADQGQGLDRLRGKTLRLNPEDGSIPEDNPVLNGVRSHVWASGFPNAQGLDFGSDGTLYNSDQGPKTDDEVNVLTKGANCG
ncbi:PQQ-dependent sugar dehydrogenase [Streptomyces flaveolus]|uniref:PQQ-dependent sugar dehydrogenase n=1 Tax=Streptomyces flaveolus TaxID=67297 RepID=UPI00331A2C31